MDTRTTVAAVLHCYGTLLFGVVLFVSFVYAHRCNCMVFEFSKKNC